MEKAGEIVATMKSGAISEGGIHAELGEIVNGENTEREGIGTLLEF